MSPDGTITDDTVDPSLPIEVADDPMAHFPGLREPPANTRGVMS